MTASIPARIAEFVGIPRRGPVHESDELDDDPESDLGFVSDWDPDWDPDWDSDWDPDWDSDFEPLESDEDFSDSDFWACLSALAASLYD